MTLASEIEGESTMTFSCFEALCLVSRLFWPEPVPSRLPLPSSEEGGGELCLRRAGTGFCTGKANTLIQVISV